MNAFRLTTRCLGLLLCAVALRGAAQEFPRPIPHESRPEEVERDHKDEELRNEAIKGKFTVTVPAGMRIHIEEAFQAAMEQQPVEIVWVKDPRTGVHNSYRKDPGVPPPGTYIDGNVLIKLQNSNISVIHSGDVPYGVAEWPGFVAKNPNAVVHLEGSQNADADSIHLASALGLTRLRGSTTRIFNALPQATGRAGERERARMGVRNGTNADAAWSSVNEGIRSGEGAGEAQSFRSEVATRDGLLRELATGTSDVVVVYAHFDGKRLHLPGDPGTLKDNTISIDDLAKIKRVGDARVG